MLLEEKLVDLLDPYDIIEDSYKDAQGRGLLERINRTVGADMDLNLLPKVDTLVETLLDPRTAEEPYLALLEAMIGDIPRVSQDLPTRRKIVQYSQLLYNIKGTKRSYELLFKLLGFTGMELREFFKSGGFDSPVTFDDPVRHFDGGGCQGCSGYDLYLTGTMPLTGTLLLTYVAVVVRICEPIDTKLRNAYYNQQPITLPPVSLYQSVTGDAMAEYNTTAPTTNFTVSSSGDLTVEGSDAGNVSMDNQGDVTSI